MKRHAVTCELQPDRIEEYKQAHDTIWPEVVAALKDAGITNLSIFLSGTRLFMYYEYEGTLSHDEAMAGYLNAPRIAEWESSVAAFKREDPAAGGNGFCTTEEIFHLD